MNKAELKEKLGSCAILGSTASFRGWLRTVLCDNEKQEAASRNLTLISYWLNAEDGTYCPVEPDLLKETVEILLDYMKTGIDPKLIHKYRYNYKKLGNLNYNRYVGGRAIVNIIHLLDLLINEYGGRVCRHCYSHIGNSDKKCYWCGRSCND